MAKSIGFYLMYFPVYNRPGSRSIMYGKTKCDFLLCNNVTVNGTGYALIIKGLRYLRNNSLQA
jgi:hypothetical protein